MNAQNEDYKEYLTQVYMYMKIEKELEKIKETAIFLKPKILKSGCNKIFKDILFHIS